jgi:hypothetical protein
LIALIPNLLRVGIVLGSIAFIRTWPLGFVLIAWALVVWLAPRACRDHKELARLRAVGQIMGAQMQALETDLV